MAQTKSGGPGCHQMVPRAVVALPLGPALALRSVRHTMRAEDGAAPPRGRGPRPRTRAGRGPTPRRPPHRGRHGSTEIIGRPPAYPRCRVSLAAYGLGDRQRKILGSRRKMTVWGPRRTVLGDLRGVSKRDGRILDWSYATISRQAIKHARGRVGRNPSSGSGPRRRPRIAAAYVAVGPVACPTRRLARRPALEPAGRRRRGRAGRWTDHAAVPQPCSPPRLQAPWFHAAAIESVPTLR